MINKDRSSENEESVIFAANLSSLVSDEILYELFLQAGPIEFCEILRIPSPYGNLGRVVFKHSTSANYALEIFRGTELFGTPLYLTTQIEGDFSDLRARDQQRHEPYRSPENGYNHRRDYQDRRENNFRR